MAATDKEPSYVERPLLNSGVIERREYQLELAEVGTTDHTLVCLPTGLGKTTVSLLVTASRLAEVGGTSLLLAPTKPLVSQHADFYRTALSIPDEEIVTFTGEVRPDDRADLWERAQLVIATPQVVENDLIGGRISLSGTTHITFDECHRASGDYAYNYIAERYHADAENPLVTGMSASPGGDREAIEEVCANLGLNEVTVMTEEDADVGTYTHETSVEWERITLPEEVIEIRDALNGVIKERLGKLKELGVARSTQPDQSQRDLNAIRAELQKLMNNDQSEGYQGMSIHAEVMKLRRAVTLAETQSVESLRRYFERQRNAARSSGASKASQRFVSEPSVRKAVRMAEDFDDLHPKFRRTRILLAETLGIEEGDRVIVFTESRDTAETLTEFLGEHFSVHKFVGQGDKEGSDGMTQKQQQETLDAFRAGEFEVLVSTSVAEEGLDVPEVDLVLFYEPVPTAIRSIQRRGRTGRQTEGKVTVLMAEDTRDEAYFWISRRRESQMESQLRTLKSVAGEVTADLGGQGRLEEYGSDREDDESGNSEANEGSEASDENAIEAESSGREEASNARPARAANGGRSAGDVQSGLATFGEWNGGSVAEESGRDGGTTGESDGAKRSGENEGSESGEESDGGETDETVATARGEGETIEIVADQRELDATIARDLSTREDVDVRLETLAVGDYVLSDRAVVERKSTADFVDSLLNEGDRSIFEQIGDAARHYARPIVILEGDGLYEQRNVHPNAIRGALASLAIDFGASVLRTTDGDDTADLLEVIARREQETEDREVSVHGEKGAKTLTEQQEYVVASIAEIGPVTARTLLADVGSVEAVMTASESDLTDVEGIGPVTAERITEVTRSAYDPD
ncbi:Hef nuclease [Halobacteriales archaeon QH_6_64_20]|nr:MAG: Hef nuclease [Halobacteriales archaeon QH_6_64_20]